MRKVKARKMAKTNLLMGLILTLAISLFSMGGGIQALSLSEAPPENPKVEEVPADSEETPVDPEDTPADPAEDPVDPEETPADPEETPDNPEDTTADPAEDPVDPETDLEVSPENVPEPVGAPQAPNTVTLLGQWVGESSKQIDTTKTYASLSEQIGEPEVNYGLLRNLAKTFLGWSDQPAINNGELAPGARLYSPYDTIGTAFPNGIPADAKLYGIYWSLNKPVTDPFPQDSLSLLVLSKWDQQLEEPVNRNSVMINSFVAGEDVLPFTKNHIDNAAGSERTIKDYYQPADEPNQVHEVVLEAQHQMDPTIAMLVYKNPVGSNQLMPLFSRDYPERYVGDNFNLNRGKAADYTYVDLVVQINPEIKMPKDVIYLQFDSYTWRPLFILDADQNKLPVLDPNNEAPTSFDNRIVQNSKTTVFAVDLSQAQLKNNDSGYQELTLRTVLRKHGKDGIGGKDILESSITPSPGKTIPETIQENMRLIALSSAQISQWNQGLTAEQVRQRVVTIPDAKAKELAEKGTTLDVKGYIEGLAVADAGTVSAFGVTAPLRSTVEILRCPANILQLGYIPAPPEPTEP
ncbi:MAG: hypothetical protein PUG36_06505, partial [Clostridiales bacterium]|nr:hypothetical protein [Clostridiales bacterium]